MSKKNDQNKNDQKKQNSIKENDVEESEIEIEEAEDFEELEEFEEFAEEDLNYDEGIFDELEFEDEETQKEMEKLKEEKLKHRRALKKLKFEMEDLSPNGMDVVKIIGFNNYAKLVFLYGGTTLYLPQHEKLIERKRRSYIYNVYLSYGSDLKKTTSIFGLSESTIRRYVADERKYQLNKLIKERKKQN